MRRHLEHLVWDEYDDEEAEALCEDVDQRLSDLVHEDDFLDTWRLKRIVKTYSDHIALPVVLKAGAFVRDGDRVSPLPAPAAALN